MYKRQVEAGADGGAALRQRIEPAERRLDPADAEMELHRIAGELSLIHISGQIEFGGSGETPARLVAGLSGAGSLALTGTRLSRFDPNAYARIIAGTGEDASESDASRLQDRLSEALDKDAWGPVSYTHLDVYKRQILNPGKIVAL